MLNAVVTALSHRPSGLRGRVIGLYALLIGANILAWAWAL